MGDEEEIAVSVGRMNMVTLFMDEKGNSIDVLRTDSRQHILKYPMLLPLERA